MNKSIKRLFVFFLICLFSVNLLTPVSQASETKIVTISKKKFVSDTLNGVNAIYRPSNIYSEGRNTTYSCAAFVKKYYKEVYGVSAYNLFYNKIPNTYEGEKFVLVTKPQVGDIAASNTSKSSTHWAIVKEVNKDNTVTLIEQNWKWMQNSKTVTKINRTVVISNTRFYRLQSENSKITEENSSKK